MASATPFLNRHPEMVLSALRLHDFDLDLVAEKRPMINTWFKDNGYEFHFGFACDPLLIRHGRVVQAAESRTDTPVTLLCRELDRLMEELGR